MPCTKASHHEKNDDLVSNVQQDWSEELILQFYATVFSHDDGSFTWMSDKHRYTSTTDEFADVFNLPHHDDILVDVYVEKSNMPTSVVEGMYKQTR